MPSSLCLGKLCDVYRVFLYISSVPIVFLAETSRTNLAETILYFSDVIQLPETDMIFAISATSLLNQEENFGQMKEIVNFMIYKYGTGDILYSIIVYGDEPRRVVSFKSIFKTDEALMDAIDKIGRLPGASLNKVLKLAKEVLVCMCFWRWCLLGRNDWLAME